MGHLSVKQEWLGDGETSSEMEQPDGKGRTKGWRATKLPSFDGTTSWEAFYAQLTVMGKLCKWSGEHKAQQLTAVLRGEAKMMLLNLAEEEMGNYHTLVATIQRRFGNTGEPELLWARFRRRARMAGESLARLARRCRPRARGASPVPVH
ncbi:hypothetical protein EOD39_12077 [Acipenser ruthenus]|uniref:Retrotransposon gag domain-containing protein n=1 Tax=Acipenser ruthenus TaxID=7906 RepID=A0A444UM13_ACIRT|nr:hypothetical protein EOD39_12077 [Acipenser ruthenus]